MDVVINLVPIPDPDQAAKLGALARPGGKVVSITGGLVPVDEASGTTTAYFGTRTGVKQLAELVRLVDRGELVVEVSGTWPLAELDDVHRLGEAGHLRGKVIVVP
jgi:NADPH:quinone reductase-like Zn-dependent oxidoreductase